MAFNTTVVLTESYHSFFRRVFRGEASQFPTHIALLFSLPFPKLPVNDIGDRRGHNNSIRARRRRRKRCMSRYCRLQVGNIALYCISRFLQGEVAFLNIPASV